MQSDAPQEHPSHGASHAQPASAYSHTAYIAGLQYKRPSIPFTYSKWESTAQSILSANAFGYVHGSAGSGETYAKNRAAFKRWSIVPSRLVKTQGFPDLRTKIVERELGSPIVVAPVGVQKIFNPDGEAASAAAAREVGVPYTMSTAASASIEEVAKANGDGERWFQLYWPKNEHNHITASLLKRAKDNGFSVLVVTLDTYTLGWRPSDMDNGYNPFIKADNIGVEIGFSDPEYQKHFREKYGKEIGEDMGTAAREWTSIAFSGTSHSWEDVKFLQEQWQGPIILKGIQSVADAKKAVEIGMQGIIVSNHGGRQADGGVGSLTMLPRIVDAVGGNIDVLFDSGIRCGADIAKALALGAKAVLIGRPYVYGLAMGGKEGVAHVLKSLRGDLELLLHLSGIPSVHDEDLNRDRLIKEE